MSGCSRYVRLAWSTCPDFQDPVGGQRYLVGANASTLKTVHITRATRPASSHTKEHDEPATCHLLVTFIFPDLAFDLPDEHPPGSVFDAAVNHPA